MTDYSRFTPAQVSDHIAFNQRSVRLQPELFDRAQRVSLERARLQREKLDAEIRAFHEWRIGYVAPKRGQVASSDADTDETIRAAYRAMERLQRTWNAVMKLDPVDNAADDDHA